MRRSWISNLHMVPILTLVQWSLGDSLQVSREIHIRPVYDSNHGPLDLLQWKELTTEPTRTDCIEMFIFYCVSISIVVFSIVLLYIISIPLSHFHMVIEKS